jgi:hypothetical protein
MDEVVHNAKTHMNRLGRYLHSTITTPPFLFPHSSSPFPCLTPSICVFVAIGSFVPYFVAKKFLQHLRKVEVRMVKRAGDLSVEEERMLSMMAVGTRTNLVCGIVREWHVRVARRTRVSTCKSGV